tara:strand:- start:497 stop:838 length:342 start_codon:yes stop_codon:yes gene_type:complete
MEKEERPWGVYEVLHDGTDCKVKKIIVNPGENPSYQLHHKRSETWIVISGIGVAKINGDLLDIKANSVITVPSFAKHTIINTSNDTPLIFIEVQTGTYFGEDDIVRLEDKYGR